MPANHREMQFSKTSINGRGGATIAAAPAEYFLAGVRALFAGTSPRGSQRLIAPPKPPFNHPVGNEMAPKGP